MREIKGVDTLRKINGNIRISFLQRPFHRYRERTDNGCLMTIRTDDLRSLILTIKGETVSSAMSDVGVVGPPALYLLLRST